MEAFVQQLVAGLATGGIYAALALALVMIYQSTHLINFAQGEMAMFSTYIGWQLIQYGMSYWSAFLLAIAISFVAGMAIQRIILRPVERAPILTNVIVFIGLLVIFNAVAGWIWEHTVKAFPSPFPADAWYSSPYFSAHSVGTVFVTLLMRR